MKIFGIAITILILALFVSSAYSQLWKQYEDSAGTLERQKQIDKAIEFYGKAREELKKDSANTNTYAGLCNKLAAAYRNTGKYEKAETFYLESKQIREKVLGKVNAGYASSCNNLAVLYLHTGKYEKAEPLFWEAKQIREKVLGKVNADYASSCNNLALLYIYMGQYGKAEPLCWEAKQIREQIFGKENIDYAGSCNILAMLYGNIGKYEKAEPFQLEAIHIIEKVLGKENNQYAINCNNLAILYTNIGQYEKAEPLFSVAKEIWRITPGKEHPYYAGSCANLGRLYIYMGEYEKSEPLLLEANHLLEKLLGKKHPHYALNCDDLAFLYTSIGQYGKAESFYSEAMQIQETLFGKESVDYAISCSSLADVYKIMGRYEKAEPLFSEAKQIREKILGKEHPDYALTCRNLATLYWDMKEPEKASELYAEAFKSQNIQIKKIFQFTNEAEKQSYLKKIADLENYLLSFNMAAYSHLKGGLSYDVSLSNRNLILSSSEQLRRLIYNTTDTGIKNKYSTWINLREQLSYWYTKPFAARPEYVNNLEEQTNAVEKDLTRLSFVFKQAQTDITWKNIQQKLKPNEAAIEFAKFNFYTGTRFTDSTYYVALLLTKNNPEPLLIPLLEDRQLNNLIKAGNTYQTITAFYKNGKTNAAYNLIWAPVEKYLKGIKKIYFAPAGLLYRIALPALPINDRQALSDKYQFVQLNTTGSLAKQSEDFINLSDKIYLYGGIKYDVDSAILKQVASNYHNSSLNIPFFNDNLTRGNSWQYLPGTETEINGIVRLGKQKNYSVVFRGGDTASEESVKALNGKTSPSVLHIATHGFFFPDPKEEKKDTFQKKMAAGNVFKQSDNPLFRSGLLFAGANNAWQGKQIQGTDDGILTAYEISNLYLPNTKLVVLSACETGLGDIQGNEGVYGLQRAFKIAGVENLVMSLWRVPDKETAEFMQQFYKNIFDKQSINDAFYNAQTAMKNKYRNEPYKWAAWILVK